MIKKAQSKVCGCGPRAPGAYNLLLGVFASLACRLPIKQCLTLPTFGKPTMPACRELTIVVLQPIPRAENPVSICRRSTVGWPQSQRIAEAGNSASSNAMGVQMDCS